jgi:hypothetical protein
LNFLNVSPVVPFAILRRSISELDICGLFDDLFVLLGKRTTSASSLVTGGVMISSLIPVFELNSNVAFFVEGFDGILSS